MIELLDTLSDWVVEFSGSDLAVLILGAISFAEAIVFPIPPDPLLVGIVIIQPHLGVWLGVLVTLASVAGAVVGHWIGRRFGRPVLHRLFPSDKVEIVERVFKKYGAWGILIAALTPVPYKVFAIMAGVLDMDRRTFILASLVGRGVRFVSIGALVMVYGKSIQEFISDHFEVVTVITAAVLLGGVSFWVWVDKRRRHRNVLR